MTAESSTNNLSPRSSLLSGDANSNPQLLPSSSSSPLPSAVAEVDTVGEAAFSDCSDLKETQLENSDANSTNVGNSKKPAWNKPLNDVVGVGPVMGGAVSWPALSESTKLPPKSTVDSSKPIDEASVSTPQVPVISDSPQKEKHANSNANANPKFTPNHTMPARQRSLKRGVAAGGGSARMGFSRPPPLPPLPPPFPVFEMPYGAMVAAMPDSSFREPPYSGNNWEARPIGGFVSQSHLVNDHSSPRNSSRRGNFGGRFRGDGLRHNSHGGRRDQDRNWNASRSYNSTDVQVTQQIAPPRGFTRSPPLGSTPFITPQPVGHFGNPMGYDMTAQYLYVPTLHPESFGGMPFIAHAPPQPTFVPVVDPNLPTLLVNQIDYYFSDANLVKDNYLRSKMDAEGWVPIALIASFPRVRQLTYDKQFILDSLRASTVVEVQGDKVRRRKSGRFPTDSGSQSPVGSTYNMLTTSLQNVSLDEATTNKLVV